MGSGSYNFLGARALMCADDYDARPAAERVALLRGEEEGSRRPGVCAEIRAILLSSFLWMFAQGVPSRFSDTPFYIISRFCCCTISRRMDYISFVVYEIDEVFHVIFQNILLLNP